MKTEPPETINETKGERGRMRWIGRLKGSIKAAHLEGREEIAAAANTDVLMIQLVFMVIDLHICGVNPT